jgi:hypothetical protein
MRVPLCFVLASLLVACGDSAPTTSSTALLPDGGRYRGALVDGRLRGQGRLDYANGSFYEGVFKDGLFHGAGTWQGVSGDRYVGNFHQGQFHGMGELTYSNGSLYQGEFAYGRLQGSGVLELADAHYRGEFLNDRYHGLGNLEWADGSHYQGYFSDGEMSGTGVLVDAEGNRYSGVFEHGLLQGEGQFQGTDGTLYIGAFVEERFQGDGVFSNGEGETWSGQFRDGALSGPGEYRGADGSHFLGEFHRWRYHGPGTLTRPDGSQLSGIWQEGVRVLDDAGQRLSDPMELALLEQGRLLDDALASLPASTPAVELYSLTLAGDGKQSVFMREADYVSTLLRERFAAHGQIVLTNHRDHLADRPLATRENLKRALETIAQRSGPEDLLFLYLTSHGSPDHALHLDMPRLQLLDLPASELASLLRPLADRHKVVVISACYSGGFIAPLKDDKTLVMTAARADRVSFGCSEENDFTYFGRALFSEALQQTDDLALAFEQARKSVAARELADGFEPSHPQLWAPPAVLTHWQHYRHGGH